MYRWKKYLVKEQDDRITANNEDTGEEETVLMSLVRKLRTDKSLNKGLIVFLVPVKKKN